MKWKLIKEKINSQVSDDDDILTIDIENERIIAELTTLGYEISSEEIFCKHRLNYRNYCAWSGCPFKRHPLDEWEKKMVDCPSRCDSLHSRDKENE
jgi:hypothetical protein